MSRQVGEKLPTLQPNQSYASTELYEQVESQQSRPTLDLNRRYANTDFQQEPSTLSFAAAPTVADTRNSKKSREKTILVALTTTLLLCLLVVCLVAVILYSPQVRTSTEDPQLTSQFQNLVRSMSSMQSNTALTLTQLREDFQDNQFLNTLQNLTAHQAIIDQLSTSVSTLTSQLISSQNLIQSLGLVQNNLREDLDRLRSVDLYQNCRQHIRTCGIPNDGDQWPLLEFL